MELHIRLDLSSPRWLRRALLLGVPLAAMATANLAIGTPKQFAPGEVLKSADLNAAFAEVDGETTMLAADVTALDTRVSTLEADPTVLTSIGTTGATGAASADLLYQGMSLDLTPGTWRVDAFMSLSTQGSADGVQISIVNDSTSMEVPNSRSAIAGTGFAGACPVGGCLGVGLATSTVVTVAVNTKIRVRAHRNGASTVVAVGPGALASPHRMTALQLR